mmetsp:Transcript_44454/g.81146  ORF Transcript_44454/g.81146 Transcript_44454/m.81146 type:complete len:507 (-) Transcript_44454:23-1543(-)
MASRRWPMGDIHHPTEIYEELDHIVRMAFHSWQLRAGKRGSRDPVIQPRNVVVEVGLQYKLMETGKPWTGDDLEDNGQIRSKKVRTHDEGFHRAWVMEKIGDEKDHVCHVPDFVLTESHRLSQMYERAGAGMEIRDAAENPEVVRVVRLGPVCRQAVLFHAVMALMKLRYLVRIHYALISFAGPRCSLERWFRGILSDTCGTHDWPHDPLPHFDVFTESFREMFGDQWAFFLAYVSAWDAEEEGDELNMSIADLSSTGQAPWSPRAADKLGESPRSARIAPATSVDTMNGLADDLFFAWLVLQDANKYPMEPLMAELDFFEIRRPRLRTALGNLQNWCQARPQTKFRYEKKAVVEAAHLSLLLDFPSIRAQWVRTEEEMLEMAGAVVAHPKTFNIGVRRRIVAVLDVRAISSLCPRVARGLGAEGLAARLELYKSYLAHPRDGGHLPSASSGHPWLVGKKAVYRDTSRWHAKRMEVTAAEEWEASNRALLLGLPATPRRLPRLESR